MSDITYGVTRTGDLPCVWLKCPFGLREQAKSIAGAKWHPDQKLWYWPIKAKGDETRSLVAIKTTFPAARMDTGGAEMSRPSSPPLPDCGPPLATLVGQPVYDWRRQPYAHQREVVSGTILRDRLLVMYEQGTGKTQGAIEAACVALESGIVQRIYVVCPTTVRRTWVEEIQACAWIAPDDVVVVRDNPPAGDPNRLTGLSDPQYRRRMVDRRAVWTIMHYEAATIEADRLAPLVKGQFLIADESHYLKNPRAQRTKAILSWQPARAILQTGTPVVNSPGDAYCVATFCEPGILGRSFYDFKDRFIVTRPVRAGGRSFDKEVGYKNLPEARRRLLSIGLRKLKSECLDLPEKVRVRRYCEMKGEQLEAYARVCGMVVEELEEVMDEKGRLPLPALVSQLVRLQQVADGYYPDPDFPDRLIWIKDAAKLEASDEVLEQAMESGRKVLVWTRFVPLARMLAKRYAKYGATYLAGEVPQDLRNERIHNFQTRDDCRVLVLTFGVGGLGLNLQVASCEIFFDRWWNPALNDQCEDRCHRSGQKNQVDIHILLAEGSIDDHVDNVVRRKAQLAATMTGDELMTSAESEGRLFTPDLLRTILGKDLKRKE